MTDDVNRLPEAFAGALHVIDVPVLRSHIEETSRWLIGEAVGELVPSEQCDALAEEIAVVLASSLKPSLSQEIVANTGKIIAESQGEPVAFDWHGDMTVRGLTVSELVNLIDAVGVLVDLGLGDARQQLHGSHLRALDAAHRVSQKEL